jgi:hypothetical protein
MTSGKEQGSNGALEAVEGKDRQVWGLVRFRRYVVVAFVVTFVAIEVVLMEEAGDWRGRKDIVYRVRVCRTY